MLRGLTGRITAAALAALVTAGALGACGDGGGTGDGGGSGAPLRLGYFPNITHATALVGVEKGIFAKHLGTAPKTATFNAGPSAVEALFSGAIDATFVGPNPSINAWAKSHGKAVHIISGAASGGVSLVVKPGIKGVQDLRGKRIATPQLGNTQDVAIRYWLKQNGLTANKDGSGDVKVVPQENSQTLQTFAQGDIDGAWVPEPYASRLILESKGKRLLDEKTLWPGGKFVITNLLVSQEYAKKNPEQVKKLLEGVVEATDYINQNQADAQKVTNDALTKLSGKPLKEDVLAAAFKEIDFTVDPVASSLTAGARHAEEIGLLEKTDLTGIYDLKPLNEVLKANGKPQVDDR
ncbi:NitT/TauT family transport system substrate-binding protein [Actinomadura meyerae]|jgi:NitT/TauT family transport system substrate-binding protein|uniref:NitT/TauT family transport system substrate-binding protein n=1 Tax=Actinomadura meyerae TaxID=240840 RepID=A0A239JFP4_9ACTN|nr:ABC transporter substrate-binding protein [Actinomadura meyerae]SNT04238.1 NitT/TauT family transport system substrate-binding protein [Actinomadura meyerae]